MIEKCTSCEYPGGIERPCAACPGYECEKCGRYYLVKSKHQCNYRPPPPKDDDLALEAFYVWAESQGWKPEMLRCKHAEFDEISPYVFGCPGCLATTAMMGDMMMIKKGFLAGYKEGKK